MKSIWLIFILINISAFTIPIMIRLAVLSGDWVDKIIEERDREKIQKQQNHQPRI